MILAIADLLSDDNKQDFSVQKYFNAYCKINNRSKESSIYSVFTGSEIEDVIVITNTDFDIKNKENILEQQNNKSDPLLETIKLPEVTPEYWKFKLDTNIIKHLRIIFENNSDFNKLIESLIAHLLNNTQINYDGIFKEYYYPLVSEILKITQEKNEYSVDLSNVIIKNINVEALSKEGRKIRDALIKEMAFIKGKVIQYELKGFGSKTLPYDENKLKDLAKSLANLTNGTPPRNDFYDYDLAKEVINTNDRKFHDIFINGKVTELSHVARKLRRILIDEFEEQDIKIKINDQETTIRALNTNQGLLKALFNKCSIKVSKGFAQRPQPQNNPQIISSLMQQVANLIKDNEESKVIKINTDISSTIDNIAGHVLIECFGKIRFSTAFLNLKSNHLPKEINAFRTQLQSSLGDDQFASLFEYEFKLDQNAKFKAYKDCELYRKLPVVYEDQDINDFFSKFTFIVKYPDRRQMSVLMNAEIEKSFKILDGARFQASYLEDLYHWIVDKLGTFYTPQKAEKMFNQIADGFLPFKMHSFNLLYFALATQVSQFKPYDCLKQFFSRSEEVSEIVFEDLFLGSTIIIQEFQRLKEEDVTDIQKYTRDFGHLFLTLNQLKNPECISLIQKTLQGEKFGFIVIECDANIEEVEVGLFDTLKAILKNKKVLIMTTSNNKTVSKKLFPDLIQDNNVIKIGFNDLTEESQQNLLNRTLKLQGKNVSLDKFINILDNIKDIDTETLVTLLKGEKIDIGININKLSNVYAACSITEEINLSKDNVRLLQSSDENILVFRYNDKNQEHIKDQIKEILGIKDIYEYDLQNINSINDKKVIISYHIQQSHFEKLCIELNKKDCYIYLINIEHNYEFQLQILFNPKLYLDLKLPQVILNHCIKHYLSKENLTDKFVFYGSDQAELTKLLNFHYKHDNQKKQFQVNCDDLKIIFTSKNDEIPKNENNNTHYCKIVGGGGGKLFGLSLMVHKRI